MPRDLSGYLDRLKAVPFVRSVSVEKQALRHRGEPIDAVIVIKTPTTKEHLYCEVKTSNMSNELAARLVALSKRIEPLIVMAPLIGTGTGTLLATSGTNFVDLRGNCYLDLGGRYVARVQGQKTGERPVVQGAPRVPAYHVLFALLADPSRISVTVRALAEHAGVSRQPAVSLRERLVELGYAAKGPRGFAWTPEGVKRAMDLWLAGYVTTVRPKLLVGTYRTQDVDPSKLEARIAPVLDRAGPWRWGGGAAAQRLTGYYRGDKTVVHVGAPLADLAKRIRAVPDPKGPLVILRSPGPAGLEGKTPDTAHPLLVYTELLADGSERARDAATRLAGRYAIGKTP